MADPETPTPGPDEDDDISDTAYLGRVAADPTHDEEIRLMAAATIRRLNGGQQQ
ncbi:hypothetical protein [Actinacidiphila sp. bgisy145]|uniref:hypothetical protein n=1 Tax=Actinacidiphila sp. bgisy145 TaxID=3413792 RepID=UPI003EBD25CE